MENKETILIRASWVSVIGNAILSLLKIGVGLFAGSLAVLGDGIDSATDVVVSLVTLFTAKIVNRPPNPKYVYGYEKADEIATKVLSFVIFFAGIQMLVSSSKSVYSAFSEQRELPSILAIYVSAFSILGKLLLSYYLFSKGKKVCSSMLVANAKNMRNDVLISTGVLLGLFFTFVLKMPILDSILGLLISIFIIKTSIEIFIESNVVLMDGMKDTSIYEKIFKAVENVPGAKNPHRVRSRQIGNLYMINLDIEADENITLKEAHDIAHSVEKSIRDSIENIYDIVVHVEPAGCLHTKEKFGINPEMIEGNHK